MKHIRQQLLPVQRLTSEPSHHLFGYYDLQPWSGDGRFHLCHRVGFRDRMPNGSDRAELGMIPIETDGPFIPIADTYVWNFQQGAMLQWHPLYSNDKVIFNTLLGDQYKGVIRNVWSGETRILSQPVANVDPQGRWALGINFSRLHDFRPGYGYAGLPDPFYNDKHPADDGVFLIDLEDGSGDLIISYRDIANYFKGYGWPADEKLLINHITFNNDGSRFVFLVRNFPQHRRRTAVLTAASDGSDIRCLIEFGLASHYWWSDPQHLIFWAGVGNPVGNGLYVIEDLSGRAKLIDDVFFTQDGHCSLSPDGTYLLYDSYPDKDGYRHLYVYDLRKQKGVTLAVLRSQHSSRLFSNDIRCDLHPRWNRDGSAISFDSTHEGHRHVYWMDLGDLDRLL